MLPSHHMTSEGFISSSVGSLQSSPAGDTFTNQIPTSPPVTMDWDKKREIPTRQSKRESARRKRQESAKQNREDELLLDEILRSKQRVEDERPSTTIKLFTLEDDPHSNLVLFESELMTKFPADNFIVTSLLPHNVTSSQTHRVLLDYVGPVCSMLTQFKSLTGINVKCARSLRKWVRDTFSCFMSFPETSKVILKLTHDSIVQRGHDNPLEGLIQLLVATKDTTNRKINRAVDQISDDRMSSTEGLQGILEFASFAWIHCLGAHSFTMNAICANWTQPKWCGSGLTPKLRLLQSDLTKTITSYGEAVQTFFKLVSGVRVADEQIARPLLQNAVHVKIEDIDYQTRLLSDPMIISMLIDHLRRDGTTRSVKSGNIALNSRIINVVVRSHDVMDSVVQLLKAMSDSGQFSMKIEQFTAFKRQRKMKKSKKGDLPHFTIVKRENNRQDIVRTDTNTINGVDTTDAVTSVTQNIRLYFVHKQHVEPFTRMLYERNPDGLLAVPHEMMQDAPRNVISYLTTLDLLHYQSTHFLTVLRNYAWSPRSIFCSMVNDWMVQMIGIHRVLWRALKGEVSIFKSIDRKLMLQHRDKLLSKESPHSRILIAIRNAIYLNRSAIYSTNDDMLSQCMDLIFSFFESNLKITYDVQSARIYQILNDSDFGKSLFDEEQNHTLNRTFLGAYALLDEELESTFEELMAPVRALLLERDKVCIHTVKRNLAVLIALFDSSRIFADHFLAAQRVYDWTMKVGGTLQNAAIVLFHEKIPVKPHAPVVLEMFLHKLKHRMGIQCPIERYVVKPTTRKHKDSSPMFELQRIP